MAFSENKHKVCPIEYNLLFGVDVGVISFFVEVEDVFIDFNAFFDAFRVENRSAEDKGLEWLHQQELQELQRELQQERSRRRLFMTRVLKKKDTKRRH